MVDPEHQPTQGEGDSPFFIEQHPDAEFSALCTRIEQIAAAHTLLSRALELDSRLALAGDISKSFVSRSGGSGMYPFVHCRLKLRPKNRINSDVKVSAIRFPAEGLGPIEPHFVAERLFVSWEMNSGEERAFVLDSDGFSRLDLDRAFEQADDTGRWPSLDARTASDEVDRFHLVTVLTDFEPDLQTHESNLRA